MPRTFQALPRTARLPQLSRIATAVALVAAGFAHANDVRPTIEAELPEVHVIATTPVGGTAIPLSKFAGNVQTINHADLPPNAQNIADVLNQAIGSVNINDTQGNPYNVDLNYRGFTSSPVLGTPQGLSVFLDGMRINEAFGDTVAWDLVPQIAIANATLVPGSNPVYGLNTLGGAVSLNTKSGFSFPGGDAKLTLGSNQRKSLDVEQGGHGENDDYYVAASLYDDKGWAVHNPSRVMQFFSKFGFQDNERDIDLSIAFADNKLYGNQNVPVSMLANARNGYTHSDYTNTKNLTLNLKGSLELGEEQSIAGNVYYRWINRDILNSNLNADISTQGACDNTTFAGCIASNLLASSTQNIVGSNLQWSSEGKLWGKSQVFTVGLNAEYARTSFSNRGQYAEVDSSNGMVGVTSYESQASIKSSNSRVGLFATDTIDATDRLAVTASARYDYASIRLSGTSCIDDDLCGFAGNANTTTDVTGSHGYKRLNPSIGATYQVTPQVTGFANYAEGFRTPSAIELACADPSAPCSGIPNAFGADPALKAVISRTIEAGLRGSEADVGWRVALFQTRLSDDILFNTINAAQGYFANVGETLRRGIEAGVQGKYRAFDYAANASWISATYESAFDIANDANSAAGTAVRAGNKIPGIPSAILKLRLGYAVTQETRIGVSTLTQSSQYARGDDNNLDSNGKVPGFTTVKLDLSHKLDKKLEVFGGIANLFDVRYATYGVVAHNNLSGHVAEQFRGLGAPRTFYLGVRGSY